MGSNPFRCNRGTDDGNGAFGGGLGQSVLRGLGFPIHVMWVDMGKADVEWSLEEVVGKGPNASKTHDVEDDVFLHVAVVRVGALLCKLHCSFHIWSLEDVASSDERVAFDEEESLFVDLELFEKFADSPLRIGRGKDNLLMCEKDGDFPWQMFIEDLEHVHDHGIFDAVDFSIKLQGNAFGIEMSDGVKTQDNILMLGFVEGLE